MELQKKAKEYLAAKTGNIDDVVETSTETVTISEVVDEAKKKGRKRKRTKEFDDDSSDESSEEEGEDDVPPGMDKKPLEQEKINEADENSMKENTSESANELNEQPNEDQNGKDEDKMNEQLPIQEVDETGSKDDINNEKEEGEENKIEEMDGMKPRPLHKVTSIFLRNLSPTITKQEVEAMCRRYPGFLRAAIADPSPERRWFRRGWVTFERDIKIKDICFNLNNIRLR